MNDDRENDAAAREARVMDSTTSSSGVFLREVPDAADEDLCRRAVEAFHQRLELPPDLEERLYCIAQGERARLGYDTGGGGGGTTAANGGGPVSPLRASSDPESLDDTSSPVHPRRTRRSARWVTEGALAVAIAAGLVLGWTALVRTRAPAAMREPRGAPSHATPSSTAPEAPIRGSAPPRAERAGRATVDPPVHSSHAEHDERAPFVVGPRRDVSDPVAPVSPRAESPAGVRPPSGAAPLAGESNRLLDAAHQAMQEGDPSRALESLQRCGIACRAGALAEEAMALKVEALVANGDDLAARVLAERFIATYPDSAQAPAIRALFQSPRAPGAPGGSTAVALAVDPSMPAPGPWALLTAPEPGEATNPILGSMVVDEVEEVEHLRDGTVYVTAIFRDPHEGSTECSVRLSALFSADGQLIDVDPASAPDAEQKDGAPRPFEVVR